MCGSAISNVVSTILSPIMPQPPKPAKAPKPAPAPAPIPPPPPPPATPAQPAPPATPAQPAPPTAQAPIIGGQNNVSPNKSGAGRGSLVIPISLGGVSSGGSQAGLQIPRK